MGPSAENNTMETEEDNVKSRHDDGRIDLDSIMEEIGQFGSFQRRLMLICAVVSILSAWTFSEYLFTTARISTRYVLFGLD